MYVLRDSVELKCIFPYSFGNRSIAKAKRERRKKISIQTDNYLS